MAFQINEIGQRDEVIAGIQAATPYPLPDGTIPPDPILTATKNYITTFLSQFPANNGYEVISQSGDGLYVIHIHRRRLSRRTP
jgi:hypothetical protein